uniref:CSON009899 protein n=1 Tax=Culicoides sonorensis TaxID=179676 RepID=A0A336M152_CULSO
MKMLKIILMLFNFLLIENCFILKQQEKLYSMKVTSFFCSDIDPEHIVNVSCFLKAKKNGAGSITLIYTYRNVSDTFTTFKLLFRNSAGHYNPFLLDVTIDECNKLKMCTNSHPISMIRILCLMFKGNMTLKEAEKTSTCPYNHIQVMKDFDVDETFRDLWPTKMLPVITKNQIKFKSCTNL